MAAEVTAQDVTVAVFPEQVVGGYPPEDLVQWRGFVAAQWRELERFRDATRDSPTVFVVGLTVHAGGQLYNCGAVVHGGRVLGVVPKEKLPTYNVFYEARTFSPGLPHVVEEVHGVPFGDVVFAFDFGTVAVEVCEDAWSPDGPMRRRCYAGAELVLNLSASPFRTGILATRREMLATRSADNQCTLAYANLLGANDGLIFDGGGLVFQNGRPVLDAPRYQEGWASCVVDLDRTTRLRTENTTWRTDCQAARAAGGLPQTLPCHGATARRDTLRYPVPAGQSFFLPPATPAPSARETFCEDLLDALCLGVGDYLEKTGAFTGIGIALSGGRDSLLTLLVAWRTLQRRFAHLEEPARGAEVAARLHAFYMPTRYSSDHTRGSAARICLDLGVPFTVVPIEEAFQREAEATRTMLGGADPTPVTMQNVQARIRAARMWNWANTSRMLFLNTGNMSEKAMGYTTIGGDLEGALAVLANVPKTVVIYLLDYLLDRHGLEGIRMTLAAPAGPELAADQKGEEELMPFKLLDACFHLYAAEKLSPAEMKEALASIFPDTPPADIGHHVDKFTRLFVQSIYKWVQAPLSLHVGNLDLERERALQLPVVETGEWAR
jgi:NAD+ synthase (glutamine-hydrolysing)